MKDITIVFHDDHVRSGATSSMLDLIVGLKNHYQIRAVIPNRGGDLASYLKSHDIKYITCRYYSARIKTPKSKFEYSKLFLKNILKIIFSSMFYIIHCGFFSKADVIYSNTSDTNFGLLASILFRKKHISHIREFGLDDQGVTHFIGDKKYYEIVLKYSDRVIVISESLRKHILSYISNHELKDKISLIYDDVHFGVNDKYLQPKFDFIRMLIVGTISQGKGQEFIIDSIYELSKRNIKVYLGIAGDDSTSYSIYLKEKVKRLGLSEQVVFHGFCNNMSILRNQYPIAVVASKSEAFGRVTIEAMGNNQLVIASNAGANPELIQDGTNGFLYEQSSVNSFCEAIIKIINSDESELHNIIKNGNSFSCSFSDKNASKKISKILLSL
ncbi:glycosyltransferase family 4 protein [Photobacterium leiognathi]|uniref:glycosyltransferase family 4 protein n=1 Tax=Photobacterium leiognathi TaxID=553611 RepID=UPI002980B162|nr:glycosyltransferase family 4 protein [Photobacterium leiognathi]